MRYIRPRHTKINESKSHRGTTSVIHDLCVCMLLINPTFLDNILDLGMKGRYISNSGVFLNDLKNLVIARNRLKIGKWVEDECVEDNEEGRINSIFNEYSNDFNIEDDWSKLISARTLARNIQDKIFIGEKLHEDNIENVFWCGPNKTDDYPEDIVIKTIDGLIYPLNINKKMNLTKSISFNTILDTILDENLLFSDMYITKWDKLCQEWCRLVYESCKPEYKSYIKRFINPERFPSITYFSFFQIKHMNPNVQNLGEYFKEFNKNILELSELLGLIYKNADMCFIEPQKTLDDWNEKKTIMLNSHIIEHLLIESFRKMSDELAKDDKGQITSNGKAKMRLTKLILDLIGSSEKDTYYFSNNGNILYKIPQRQFFRDNYNKLSVLFDIHTQLIPDENSDASQLKLQFKYEDKQLLHIEINTSFGGLEMNGKLSSKFKIFFESDFNYKLYNLEEQQISEKLSSEVYHKAADKLKSLGHTDRSNKLKSHSISKENDHLLSNAFTVRRYQFGSDVNVPENKEITQVYLKNISISLIMGTVPYDNNNELTIQENRRLRRRHLSSNEGLRPSDVLLKVRNGFKGIDGTSYHPDIKIILTKDNEVKFRVGSIKFTTRKDAMIYRKALIDYLESDTCLTKIDTFADEYDLGPNIKYLFIDAVKQMSLNLLYN